MRAKMTQAEIHLDQGGKKAWKMAIRQCIVETLKSPGCNCFDNFVSGLKARGIQITRKTEKSLTLSDKGGNKVRLNILFSRHKNKADIERVISVLRCRRDTGQNKMRNNNIDTIGR